MYLNCNTTAAIADERFIMNVGKYWKKSDNVDWYSQKRTAFTSGSLFCSFSLAKITTHVIERKTVYVFFYILRRYWMKRENGFQAELIKELKAIFSNAVILKNDSSYLQGIADLCIFVGNKWAFLECQKSCNESHQPNQDYYIQRALDMGSYGAFIFPENKDKIIEELRNYFS